MFPRMICMLLLASMLFSMLDAHTVKSEATGTIFPDAFPTAPPTNPANAEVASEHIDNSLGKTCNWSTLSKNLFELKLEGVSRKTPDKKHLIKTISASISPLECSIHAIGQYDYLQVGDLEPSTSPGEPQLPMKTFVVRLPKDSEVLQANVVAGSFRELEGELYLAPTPQPTTCDSSKENSMSYEEKLVPDKHVYSLETRFPGRAVSYDKGSDGKNMIVFIRYYPVQYMPAKKRVFLITIAEINLYYTVTSYSDATFSGMNYTFLSLFDAENIIITPSDFVQEAQALANLHDASGINTAVVETTWIYSSYAEASDPPYEGYTNPSLPEWNTIIGYNYSLAKRTISFLRDNPAHPNLNYVTLLGAAEMVPPSYYIYFPYFGSFYYMNWIPTDFFYASPDYDLVPNYKVGRLPVHTVQEAEHIVSKIESWQDCIDYSWFRNVVLAGGNTFWNMLYVGEMVLTDAINRECFNGMNITKRFHTDGEFDRQYVLDALAGDTGILYVHSHGDGGAIFPDGYGIGINNLQDFPSNSRVPVVVSPACVNAFFDARVMHYIYDTSFGEGILLSNAAGIAYVGASRVAYAGTSFYFDRGELHISKESFIDGMLTYFFDAYHNGICRLGGIAGNAMEEYVANNIMNMCDQITLFEFCLLGDPALQLPAQQSGTAYQKPDLTALNARSGSQNEIPIYFTGDNITVNCKTDSPAVRIRNTHIESDQSVWNDTISSEDFNYTFEANFGTYLARFVSADEKEGWMYVSAPTVLIRANGSIDPPDMPILNVDNTTYIFTTNINNSIVVERDNIIIDGAGYTLSGPSADWGFFLSNRERVTIINMRIKTFPFGIWLNNSAHISIVSCNITECINYGIVLIQSSNNSIHENNVSHNVYGIWQYPSTKQDNIASNNVTFNGIGIKLEGSSNTVRSNTIASNDDGLVLSSPNNVISSNTITKNANGIWVQSGSVNNSINGNVFTDNDYGVWLFASSNNSICKNNIANSKACGVLLVSSSRNTFSRNSIKMNALSGIFLSDSSNYNTLFENNIISNNYAVQILSSSYNLFYHNDFLNNTSQVLISPSNSANSWDNGYPSGGNYWSDYVGTDLFKGVYQNETGSDGITDAPYVINTKNTDRYPLVEPYVSLTGDLNHDGKVDGKDVAIVSRAYDTHPQDPKWDVRADTNGDGKVDGKDIAIVTKNYGKRS